jgi:hypothetical protein
MEPTAASIYFGTRLISTHDGEIDQLDLEGDYISVGPCSGVPVVMRVSSAVTTGSGQDAWISFYYGEDNTAGS